MSGQDSLTDKLVGVGVDLESLSTEDKILYVWKLYLASEAELGSVLEKYESAKSQHAAEVQEIEAYVEQIKSLSDERESLTLEFEKENDLLKLQMETEKTEVTDMLSQQALDDLVTSSVPELVAFLLVERAKLLDALENEISRKHEAVVGEATTRDGVAHTDDSSGKPHTGKPDKKSSCDDEELTNISADQGDNLSCQSNEELSSPSTHPESLEEECDGCRKLRKESRVSSDKLIVAEEQLKSLERRINRYKVLLGEDVVHKDDEFTKLRDDVTSLQEKLKSAESELAGKEDELNSSTGELSQVKAILESFNQRYENYEQTCHPFDATQTTMSTTQMSMTLTQTENDLLKTKQTECSSGDMEASQSHNDLLVSRLKSLESELSHVKETAADELEQTILDYEQKLESLHSEGNVEKHPPNEANKLREQKAQLDKEISRVKGDNSRLEDTVSELTHRVALLEQETVTYQNELEQVFSNQEEELERNELLQQQLDQAVAALKQLQDEVRMQGEGADSVTQEHQTLLSQYEDLESQHTELLQRLSSLTTDYEAVMDKLSSLTEENQKTSLLYQQSMEETQKIANEYSALQQIHEILNEDVENFMSEKEAMEKSNVQLSQQLAEEKEFHHEELSHSDQRISSLTEELSARESELSALNFELENLRKTLSQKEDVIDDLNEQQEITLLKISTAENKRIKLQAALSKMESEIHASKDQLDSQNNEKFNQVEENETLKNQVLELEGDNFRLAESLRTLTSQLENKDTEVKLLEQQLREAYEEQSVAQSTKDNSFDTQDEQDGNLVEKMADLMSDHKLLSDEHQTLLTEYGDMDLRLSETEKECESVKKERDSLRDQIEALQGECESLTVKINHLQADYEKVLAAQNVVSNGEKTEQKDVGRYDEEIVKQSKDEPDGIKIHPRPLLGAEQHYDDDGNIVERLAQAEAELRETMEQHKIYQMEWESSMKERDNKNSELTERIILLEKAANELEGDNRDLALRLREALSQCESIESNYKHEVQRLKSSNTRIQEQLERSKKYSDSIEKEMETMQEKLKNQSQTLQNGSEKRESEILVLKTEISQLKLAHSQQVDTLESKLKQANTENRIIQGNLEANTEELSALRTDSAELQSVVDEERMKNKKLESRVTQLDMDSSRMIERLKEATERRAEVDRENEKLTSEIRAANSKTESIMLTQDTDNNKALELAETRITSLEKQRDDLRSSVQQVTVELEHANQSIHEVSELRLELQAKKDEIIRLKSQLKEEQTQRSYDISKIEELKHSLGSSNQREQLTTEQNNELRHKILDLEAKLSKLQTEKNDIQHTLSSIEGKNKSVTQKISNLTAEKETLEIELMAANEKLQLHVQRYQERKNRHRNRIRTNRLLHETEIAKLRDRIEYLDRDVTLIKQSLEQEENLKLQSETKYAELVANHRQLLSKQVDLEDEIRERNRGIALLQTKLQYTDQENTQLTELCNKLKHTTQSSYGHHSTGTDIMDTILAQQTPREGNSHYRRDATLDMSMMTLGRTTSMESLQFDFSKQTPVAS